MALIQRIDVGEHGVDGVFIRMAYGMRVQRSAMEGKGGMGARLITHGTFHFCLCARFTARLLAVSQNVAVDLIASCLKKLSCGGQEVSVEHSSEYIIKAVIMLFHLLSNEALPGTDHTLIWLFCIFWGGS